MKAKRFNYWFTQELHEQFGLIREDNSPNRKTIKNELVKP